MRTTVTAHPKNRKSLSSTQAAVPFLVGTVLREHGGENQSEASWGRSTRSADD